MRLKLLWFCALLAACACLNAAGETGTRSPSAEGATIAFANLSDGDVVPPSFVARFTISGMGIAPAGTRIDNTGHFHLLIDLEELPDFDQPLPANEQLLHFGMGQTQVELGLAPGEHALQLLLADYAHVPHDPPVMSEVITITVAQDAPPQSDP